MFQFGMFHQKLRPQSGHLFLLAYSKKYCQRSFTSNYSKHKFTYCIRQMHIISKILVPTLYYKTDSEFRARVRIPDWKPCIKLVSNIK